MMNIAFICTCLLATDGEILAYDLNRGTEFIIAFCEHMINASIPSLTIINDNDLPATVNISTPKAPSATPPLSITVTDTKTVTLHQSVIQIHTSFKSLAVWVTSDRPVAVQGFSSCGFFEPSLGAFQAIPVQELGTEHVVVTICQKCSCIIMIVGTADQTDVTVELRIKRNFLIYKSRKYITGQVMKETLDRYDSLQIESQGDLSGTFIHSNKPIVVFSGADCTTYGSKRGTDSVVENIPHLGLLGTRYVIPFLPDLSKYIVLKITAVNSNTILKLFNTTYRFHEFQSRDFTLNVQDINTLSVKSNHPVLVLIVVKSWGYYNLKPKHNVDVSLSVLYPVNWTKAILNLSRRYRIRGMFPADYDGKNVTRKLRKHQKRWHGKVEIDGTWYMIVTDENCDVSQSSVFKRDPQSHYAVLGFYFPRSNGMQFTLEPLGHCLVFSGIQWMRGLQQGGMMPWPITYIPSQNDSTEEIFFCKTTLWVQYILEKKFKSLEFITEVINKCKLICCP